MVGVVSDPVGVEEAQGAQLAASALLGDGLEVAVSLDLVHTGSGRLAVADPLGDLTNDRETGLDLSQFLFLVPIPSPPT